MVDTSQREKNFSKEVDGTINAESRLVLIFIFSISYDALKHPKANRKHKKDISINSQAGSAFA